MDLHALIEEKLKGLFDNGTVATIVEKNLTKSLEDTMRDLLSNYGDFSKDLKTIVGEKLKVSLQGLDINEYSIMINNVVTQAINGTAVENARGLIEKSIAEVLWVMEAKSWKLSDLIGKFMDSLHGSGKGAFQVEEMSYKGGHYLYVGEKKEAYGDRYSSISSKKQDFQYTIFLDKDGEVFSVLDHGKVMDPRRDKPNHWEVFLMNLWANGCTIVLDEEDAEYVAERGYND